MPRVSVIIPAYNSARYLLDAIDSVFAQTYKDLEVIVIDDGSTDNTKEILEPYMDRIIFLQQVNSGPSKARNLGIQRSSGEYLAFLDADDIWFPEKLEKQVRLSDSMPEVGMVYTDAVFSYADGSRSPHSWLSTFPKRTSGSIFESLLSACFILIPTVMVRRECLIDVSYFREDLKCWEGYDLWLKIAFVYPIEMIEDRLVVRRVHDKNLFYSSIVNELHGLIQIYEGWLSRVKELSDNSVEIIRRNLKRNYRRLGIYHLAQCQPALARQAFLQSLHHGISCQNFPYLALTFLSPGFIQKIRHLKRLLFRDARA
ncbi:MAG: glycosyltransferase family 2 protein [Nitrospira sp.]|nr:glycosyltransferase family 2 protein [Nitrospira sp.]